MAEFRKFQEYLDSKKHLVEKGKVEKVPDYTGPDPKSPPSAEHKPVGDTGSATPYRAPGSDPGQPKPEKDGFGDKGDKALVYEPKTDVPEKVGDGGKEVPTWPKTKTESFLDETKELSLPEFAKYVRKTMNEHCGCEEKKAPHVVAYSAGAFHPDPIQAIKYVVYLTNENEHILRALVHEARRAGCLDKYVNYMLEFPETYQEIADRMNDTSEGPKVSRRIVKAMNDSYNAHLEKLNRIKEQVGPPAHKEEDDGPPRRDPRPDQVAGIMSGGNEDHPKMAHDHLLDAMKSHEAMKKTMGS